MEVKIKRIDKSLPLPEFKTPGSVGFDLYTIEDAVIPAGEFRLLPANFIIETPPGYMLMIAARSSSAMKKGLNMRNGIGVIDQDYCGEDDRLHIMVQNLTDENVEVKRGERLAQGIFVKIKTATWQEVDAMNQSSRGGFGSTGHH